MEHRITYNDATVYWNEMCEVEKKIRASHCRKRNFPLCEFNWWIRSVVMYEGSIFRPAFLLTKEAPRYQSKVLARLVATTQGTSYSSGLIVPVPDWVLEYWGRN